MQAPGQGARHHHRAGPLPPQLVVHQAPGTLQPCRPCLGPPAARSRRDGQQPVCLRNAGAQQVLSHLGAQAPTLLLSPCRLECTA